MPRVHRQKAAKDYPEHGIAKGDTYYRWAFRYGGKRKSKTYPRPSQLTQSKLGDVLAAYEGVQDDLELMAERGTADPSTLDWDALVQPVIDQAEETAEEYEQADEDMGGHQGINYERAEGLREIESAGTAPDVPERDDSDTDEDWEQKVADFWEEAEGALQDMDPESSWPG